MNQTKIGVIGAGSWGTALSLLLAKKGYEVDLWVYEKELCSIIRETRINKFYLPDFSLPDNIRPFSSLEQVASEKSIIVLVTPTHVLRQTAERFCPLLSHDCLIVNASKGIENDSLRTVSQILDKILPESCEQAAISGPTFALELARGNPSAIVAAARRLEIAERVQDIFSAPTVKVFTSDDLLGVELGGALKNVIAIATGISDGLNLGHNARAALITRGLVEMKRIGAAMGARPETFSGLSGMGDLTLTCTGDLSRNRSVGLKLGQGMKIDEITRGMKMVAEGINTVISAHQLKNKFNIQASIIEETYNILHRGKSPQQGLQDLLKVETTTEFSGVKGME